MAAAEPQVQLQVLGGRVDVASPRENHTPVRYHERPVELGELLERLSRRSGSSMRLLSWGWPYKGSRIMGLECPRTASESPTTKRVPILRPSLPSRAISTARFTTLLSVLLFTPRLSEQISSSNPASGPVLSGTPPPPSDEPVLPDASSTALSSPSRSI